MSGILFGFKDIVNSSPKKSSIFDLSSYIIQDSYVKSISPKRYNFYVKFINGLNNPEALSKFLYTVKESKDVKKDLDDKIQKLTNILSKLYNKEPADQQEIINNVKEAIKNKLNLDDKSEDLLEKMLKKKGGSSFKTNFLNVIWWWWFKKF